MPEELQTVEMKVQGMHCTNCALGIEKQLTKMGIPGATADFTTSTVTLPLTQPESLPGIISQIEQLGYTVIRDGMGASAKRWSLEAKFYFCLFWTVPLLLHMFLPFHLLHQHWFQLLACTPVFLVGFVHFGRSAVASVRTGVPNMDVLIIIGISAAFGYSLFGTLSSGGENYLFYETSATIITIVLFGNLLEERSVRKTSSALEELTKIQTSIAKKIVPSNGQEQIVEIDSGLVALGDILLVNQGEKVPVDGIVVWGQGAIDQSIISGESVPVPVMIDTKVIGGTVVSLGNLKIKALAIGQDTVIAAMIRLVRQAQSNKPAIQRIGDQVSAIFVPTVIVFAILTFLVSYFVLSVPGGESLLRAIAVLVISCPCAMGLATPTAVMAGIGRAAQRGILLKGGQTLERFAKVKMIVFDKTGTLTSGKFKIKSINPIGTDIDHVKRIILGLEKYSAHPIARSIVNELKAISPFEFSNVQETKGIGIEALGSDQAKYKLGSRLMLPHDSAADGHDLFLFRDNRLIATIDIEDELKANAINAVSTLRELGVSSAIVSGDTTQKVSAVANMLGISEFYAEQLPQQKLVVIEQLEKNMVTAFVGDGINDAPALARASVGISLSDATQAAIQQAQIVLLNGDLAQLVMALKISRLTLTTIKQNLFWAFFYNIMAIPIAAAGYLSPSIAALAMACSDVIVILNSLRLKARKI